MSPYEDYNSSVWGVSSNGNVSGGADVCNGGSFGKTGNVRPVVTLLKSAI